MNKLPRPKLPAKSWRPRLGDAVHSVAHPVAKIIDKVAGTNLRNCGECARRREQWNRLIR